MKYPPIGSFLSITSSASLKADSREAMMSAIDPIEICPRCHGGGLEPVLDRKLFDRIRGYLRPTCCYVCHGAGVRYERRKQ